MNKQYDLVIIGAGTAAMTAAMPVRAAGWQVAVIDYRPFGGTCALRGCDPKKMLIGGTSAFDHARRMRGKGLAGDAHIDWAALMAFKRTFTDPVSIKTEHQYKNKGVDTFHGTARFVGKNTLQIGGELLDAKHILIASGAEAIKLNIPGEEYLINNEGFLELESLPHRIVLVGGGYIAAEFSHIAARAGANVTILQHAERMLTEFDGDLVDWLMPSFKALCIDVKLSTTVEKIEKIGNGYLVFSSRDGKQSITEADLVVHAAGRKPAFASMDLLVGGIEIENGRLTLNEYLQSVSNPSVYAAGDAAQMGPPLTPVSSHDAKIVAANLLNGNQQKPDYRGVPSVAFTLPPIAAVGITEADARKQGLRFKIKSQQTATWFAAQQQAEPVNGFKVLVDEKTDQILGAHLVGPNADEIINLFALAIRHGLTTQDLKTTMFAYPTGASDIGSML
ncbi:dihydrolipoyl dehydrogenase family protein [Glaciimonas immobilis]|uniref:Glutathione reductase (NADPH) n=1 Tax=Glaciimonas immobilis TaxID=728004 RepID=A0A840RR29_9BURK|nr:NAD(P)/FAD-dependent oxidoreductase [Glaciimonas immobilis]KAF3999435.1 NAD(P)/FAD-dependent oxidoreductase [Glaciimonas immobilis]MBB5198939.1 glutathione reductase (NADPH) [Glaciimonas immobilis]